MSQSHWQRGQALANGQPLGSGDPGTSRGTLTFSSGGNGPVADLGSSGNATYQVKLYPGSYDVIVDNAGPCSIGPLPCGRKTVKTIALTTSGAQDVDVRVVRVSGTLTVNGNPPSNSTASRGTISFDGPSHLALVLGATGAATFSVPLYPGSYRVELENQTNCELGPLPCQRRQLDAARSLIADGSLTWDLPVVEVAGVVTLNGQPVGIQSANPRGELLFRNPESGTMAVSLGAGGPAGYRVRLYSAGYQVLFRNATDCQPGDTQAFPCQGEAEVVPSALLTASGSRDLDLKSFTLSGRILVNAFEPAASGAGASRAVVRFATSASEPASRRLTSSGPATFALRLLAGRYDVGLENVDDCGPGGALPCQKQVLAGCGAP